MFCLLGYLKLSATKSLWNVFSNIPYIRRKTNNEWTTLNILSLNHHRVTSSIFTITFEWLARMSWYFQCLWGRKTYIFRRKKELPNWSYSWEKLEIVMPKRHRVTLGEADVAIFIAIAPFESKINTIFGISTKNYIR